MNSPIHSPDHGLPSHSVCERARHSRDARFDGRFFIAVKSTHIYCRPICPAPTARAANVTYFASAAAAAEAGFRPCLRCRPEVAPGTPAWQGTSTTVARGLRLIGEGALDDAPVEQLATRLGVTPRHLTRLFRQHLGASPVAIAQTRRLQFAKHLIDDTTLPFGMIADAAGFGSVRRFNHLVQGTWGRSPTQLRRLHKQPVRETDTDGSQKIVLRVNYRPPLDWEHWLGFLERRAIPDVEIVNDDGYSRLVRTAAGSGWINIQPSAGEHCARVTAHGIGPAHLFETMSRVRSLLDANADPASIAATLVRDPLLRAHVERHPGIRLPGAWEPFEIAVRAVLGQQISVAAARTLAGRLVARFGQTVESAAPPGLTHHFPDPEVLAQSDLATIGLPGKRAAALRGLAAAVAQRRIDFTAPPDELRRALIALPGIGPWTAHYVSMRALGDPDALPAEDIVLRNMLGRENRLSARAVELHAEAWRPWRAYGLMHVWAMAGERQAQAESKTRPAARAAATATAKSAKSAKPAKPAKPAKSIDRSLRS